MMGKELNIVVHKTNKPIRPVLIVSEQTLSDYTTFLKNLLVGLADASIPAAIVCGPDSQVESVVPYCTQVIRYPFFDLPLMGHSNRKMLAAQLSAFRPTVLHCLCQSQAVLGRKLARMLNLPYVLSVNSLQRRWIPMALLGSRCVDIVVPALSITESIKATYPRIAGRLRQVNMGTFVNEPTELRPEPGHLPVFVAASQFEKVEAFESLLAAIRHLVIDGYEFMFVLMGEGAGERQLRISLQRLGLEEVVVIIPRLKRWTSAFGLGDVFVRAWPNDAFDPYLLEAMSAGMALAGCRGGVDDLLVEGQTAVLFEADNELSIYNGLQRLLDRPELARKLGRGAIEYLQQHHSVSKMIADMLQIYQDAGQ